MAFGGKKGSGETPESRLKIKGRLKVGTAVLVPGKVRGQVTSLHPEGWENKGKFVEVKLLDSEDELVYRTKDVLPVD